MSSQRPLPTEEARELVLNILYYLNTFKHINNSIKAKSLAYDLIHLILKDDSTTRIKVSSSERTVSALRKHKDLWKIVKLFFKNRVVKCKHCNHYEWQHNMGTYPSGDTIALHCGAINKCTCEGWVESDF